MFEISLSWHNFFSPGDTDDTIAAKLTLTTKNWNGVDKCFFSCLTSNEKNWFKNRDYLTQSLSALICNMLIEAFPENEIEGDINVYLKP